MRKDRLGLIISIIAVTMGIAFISIALSVFPTLLLKYIDVAVFTVLIGLSVVCVFRGVRGSVLILACWCILTAANVFLRLYPFSPEGYIGFISYALPAAETVCALLSGLWLIRLQKEKERA